MIGFVETMFRHLISGGSADCWSSMPLLRRHASVPYQNL
jgi:hypothetical protein